MQITKRDGRIEEFQAAKVIKALSKAFRSCDKKLPEDLEQAVVEHVTKKAQKCERDGKEFRTEDVDNIIEKVLQQGKQHSAFKVYAKKRRDRNRKRTEAARNVFRDIIDIKNTDVTRENANMNADTPAGMMMKFASESTKSFVDEELLEDDVRQYVKENKLHVHDKDYYPTRSFTCLDGKTSIVLKNEHGDVIYTNLAFFDKYINQKKLKSTPTLAELNDYFYILGRNGWTRVLNVSKRYLGNKDKYYHIKTKKGLGLNATADHQIPVIDKTTGKERLKRVSGIEIGDCLVVKENIVPVNEEYIDVVKELSRIKDIDSSEIVVTNIKRLQKWLDYKYDVTYLSGEIDSPTYRQGVTYLTLEQYRNLDEKYNIPDEVKNTLSIKIKRGKDRLPFYIPVTPELAEAIGYIHSEGSVSYIAENSSYQMAFVNYNERMIERFNRSFSSVFSNNLIPRYTVRNYDKVHIGTCIASKLIVYMFKYVFGKRGGSSDIFIPSFIKKASEEIKWHYLSALFDGDGCVKDWDTHRLVRYTTVSPDFANEIVELLDVLGVKSSLRKVESKDTETTFPDGTSSTRNYDTYVITITGKENLLKVKDSLVCVKQMVDDVEYAARPLVSSRWRPEEVVDKIELSKTDKTVYDVETVEHWFVANGYVVHNCVQHPLDHILEDGFQAGHGSSRPAKRIETASVLACISMETAQNEMHGGQAIPAFDFYLAPYVRLTFIEEIKKLAQYDGKDYSHLYNVKISDYIKKDLGGLKDDDKIIQCAINNTVGRVHQAMEAFIHNMNTIHSRGGNQVVFSSINFGTDTSPEGRCIIREILLSTYEGVGNGETAIFPIQIWKSKSGVSYLPGDPNYDLYELACKVTARRFFPNFLNLDATYNQDSEWKADDPKRYEHEVATMGCRTRVFENRFGPKTSIGRGNISFSTINIVRLAIECMDIADEKERIDTFFTKLDECLDITAKQLDDRFNFQKQALAKQFPLLMTKLWVGCENLSPTDRVESVINQGTLGIGFIGLAECLVALTGKHHGESEHAQELGLKIVTHMRDRVNGYCEKYKHNYSVLATPAEGLSGKFTKVDQKEFGKIPGVTDRDYYTNSNHVPVYYKCSARHKAEIEAPYHNLTRGGHIFYVEIDGDATHNPDVVKGVVDMMHAYDMGYGSINHNRNRCMDCGYEDATEGLTVCPKCGGKNIDKLQRITGYLVGTTERWNHGKLSELRDRVTHVDTEK